MRSITLMVAALMFAMCCGCSQTATRPDGASARPAPAPAGGDDVLDIVSPAFVDGARIPAVHATRAVTSGENLSIPLRWTGVPAGAKSIVLSVVDHSPVAREWVHWVAVDMPPDTTELAAGASGQAMPVGSRELLNTSGSRGYSGPQPPPGSGDHPYEATIYALDVATLDIPDDVTAADIERAVSGHVLASGSTTGVFSR